MSLLYRLLCGLVCLLARAGGERELEIVVLRHQLAILGRSGKRPRYTCADRALLGAASRVLPPARWSCFAVTPQTLPAGTARCCWQVGDSGLAGSVVPRLPPRCAV
jgi:hypothetical protein